MEYLETKKTRLEKPRTFFELEHRRVGKTPRVIYNKSYLLERTSARWTNLLRSAADTRHSRGCVLNRYCRDRCQAFAGARLGKETVDFGRSRTENYTMGESGSELSRGRLRNPSPNPNRGRFHALSRTSQSPARRPSRSPSRRRRNVQALVDSGADYSVISEAFRRSINATVFKENGQLLRAAEKKPIPRCYPGLGFLQSHRCPFRLWEKQIIVVTNQDVFGSRVVVVTGSKHLQLEKGPFILSPIVGFLNGRASKVTPSDMKVGTMQYLEVGSISNLDARSEIAGKDEVTSQM
ncbi:hypothetical protein LAZ67_2002655 [Cordylochernes scorpioides]|uniref:Peptidase A2 domain-containing protein n=1 Tax=Cordylochernes scorpioides TaxID=51811 RepID=A0ABY6K255_9ARAC|nr:hypothetical protein LAZ67_2002655 [Cordylochernes scorpioides]